MLWPQLTHQMLYLEAWFLALIKIDRFQVILRRTMFQTENLSTVPLVANLEGVLQEVKDLKAYETLIKELLIHTLQVEG